ncbi:MAG TPA: stage II sporulation protein M [Rubricoccaceae bacterium]|jgi:uncharacterized membrane protein SpoIIM required for sporulation
MRESVFVRRHAPDWEAFEDRLAEAGEADADALADGYVRLGDDLAYAQTFFPGSVTAAYLNDLQAEAHRRLYRNRREERGRLVRFWTHEVPLAAYESQRALGLALLLFLGAIALGAISAAGDDRFARLVLGDGYVSMTEANIESGDPLAVYKDAQPVQMSVGIALNNVLVSFMAFVGVLNVGGAVLPGFALGSAQALFNNGVMVGVFTHLFASRGLGGTFARVVFIHGALELSAIVVAGGAGFVMGGALLFPGTYPRLASFREGALRGTKLILGLVPIFLAAAALEGFVTRHTEMPLALAVAIIAGSFAFMAFYYVWWPRRVAASPRLSAEAGAAVLPSASSPPAPLATADA